MIRGVGPEATVANVCDMGLARPCDVEPGRPRTAVTSRLRRLTLATMMPSLAPVLSFSPKDGVCRFVFLSAPLLYGESASAALADPVGACVMLDLIIVATDATELHPSTVPGRDDEHK